MIATWQYLALIGIVIAVMAILQYGTWRTRRSDSVFFPRLEAEIANALAPEHFVLTSKTHTPNSFGHRSWRFERRPAAIHVYWDGKEREISAQLQEAASLKLVPRRLVAIGIGTGNSSERRQHALNALVEAIIAALRTETPSTPLP